MMYKNILELVLILTVLFISSCESDQVDVTFSNKRPAPKLAYKLAAKSLLSNQISVPGQLLPFEQITVFSEVSGYMDEVSFEEGEIVNKGQALVKINSDRIQAEIRQLEVDLSLAKKEAERQSALMEMNATSTELAEQAEARVAQITAQIERLTIEIDKSTIRAPFTGKMGLRQISSGAYITPSQAIASLAQVDFLKLEFALPQQYASAISIGDTVQIAHGNQGETFKAVLFAKEPFIDPATKTLTVRAKLKENKDLYPGAFVTVQLEAKVNQEAFLIPSEALTPVLNGQKIWIKRNGLAVSELVTPGVRTDKEIAVSGNISIGDTILTTGLLGIREGMHVDVKDTAQ